jgi:hypothetical protein
MYPRSETAIMTFRLTDSIRIEVTWKDNVVTTSSTATLTLTRGVSINRKKERQCGQAQVQELTLVSSFFLLT